MFYQKFVEASESYQGKQQQSLIQERHKWPAGSLAPQMERQSEVPKGQSEAADALKDLRWERSDQAKAERSSRSEGKADRTVKQSECCLTLYSSPEGMTEGVPPESSIDVSAAAFPIKRCSAEVVMSDTLSIASSDSQQQCQATRIDSPKMHAQLPYGFLGLSGLAMASKAGRTSKKGWKVWPDRRQPKVESGSQ
eukprot:6481943-Amphidinium_carterae.1